jgi:thiol:disulfide interchange protein
LVAKLTKVSIGENALFMIIPAQQFSQFLKHFQRLRMLLTGLVLIGGLLLGSPAQAGPFSALRGLITLKHLAEQSVPYPLALSHHRPIFLEFYADWCTTCQGMAPSVETLHQKYGDAVDFVLLDIDDPQWENPIDRFRVTGVPQITLLGEDQQILDSWIGSVPHSILDQALAQMSDSL